MKDSDWAILHTLYNNPSITKTADLLYMTQPTLTKRLQQIEAEFGVQIAIRNTKGVIFTPPGEYLAKEAGRVLQDFQRIRENIMRISDGHSGTINIGVTNSYGRYTLPPLLHQYKEIYPNINFGIQSGLSSQIVKMAETKEIHVGFIRGDFEFSGIQHLISVDQSYAVSRNAIQLDDLPHLPRIVYTLDPATNKMLDNWWYSHFNTPPRIGMHVNHGDTCREMVLSGLGYGIFLVPDFIEGDTQLFRLPLYYKNGPMLKRNAWVIYHKDFESIPLIRKFAEFIKFHVKPKEDAAN